MSRYALEWRSGWNLWNRNAIPVRERLYPEKPWKLLNFDPNLGVRKCCHQRSRKPAYVQENV